MDNNKKGTQIGTRLALLRKESLLSLEALSSLSKISKATLSRIENGSNTFEYYHIKILAEIFGMNDLEFQDPNGIIPNAAQTKNSIKKFIKDHELSIGLSDIYRKSTRASFYINKMIESDFLKEEKTMKLIIEYCYKEYGVQLVGSDVSNILKRRKEKGIIAIIKQDDYNGFYYKKI